MTELGPIAELFLYLSVLVTLIYTLIASYHWFSYGESQKINWLALTIFLAGAGVLIITMFLSYVS